MSDPPQTLEPKDYPFVRYLAAKQSVDDRALNRDVWQTLVRHVSTRDLLSDSPLRVLEVACGIGTMVTRAMDWSLANHCDYTAVDADGDNMRRALEFVLRWAGEHGLRVETDRTGAPATSTLHMYSPASGDGRPGLDWTLHLERADAFEFARGHEQQGGYDLIIAHAFLDLVDITAALPVLLGTLKPGALFYFTINFDGATILQPDYAPDPALDARIEALYHATMDHRIVAGRPSGDSRTGRHLFPALRRAGGHILAAGSSDWVVFAAGGSYHADEAYFLHFIIHTMEGALTGHPDLESRHFREWVRQRHEEIRQGDLVYIAHQLDILGQAP